MRTWGAAGAILAIAAVLVLVWMNRAPPTVEPTAPSVPSLEATRLLPSPDAAQEVEADPFANVEFVYLVRNSGSQPIRGLKIRQGCRCVTTETTPEEIAPGEAARMGFRLQAPDFGTDRRRVELVIEQPPIVVLALDVAVRAKFTPPALARRPEGARLTFVEGETSPRELSFDSMEKRDAKPWIEGVTFEPKNMVRVAATHVDEFAQLDPELTRRTYRFELSPGLFRVGTYRGFYRLTTRCDPKAMESPLPLEVEVLDRVAIVPNPVSFAPGAGAKSEPARIVVIRRAGEGAIEVAEWDRRLLDVRAVESDTGKRALFAVVPKIIPTARRETKIVFGIGARETREVLVRLLPAELPGKAL